MLNPGKGYGQMEAYLEAARALSLILRAVCPDNHRQDASATAEIKVRSLGSIQVPRFDPTLATRAERIHLVDEYDARTPLRGGLEEPAVTP